MSKEGWCQRRHLPETPLVCDCCQRRQSSMEEANRSCQGSTESCDSHCCSTGEVWHKSCTTSAMMRKRGALKESLLLVSNDRQLRHQLLSCLAKSGLTSRVLTTVRNGQACCTALARIRPRLVMLDDGIRDFDARELISAVHQRFSEVLVVYLATQHTPEIERTVRQLGVLYYTEKPPDSDVLQRLIGAAFASAQTEAQSVFHS